MLTLTRVYVACTGCYSYQEGQEGMIYYQTAYVLSLGSVACCVHSHMFSLQAEGDKKAAAPPPQSTPQEKEFKREVCTVLFFLLSSQ